MLRPQSVLYSIGLPHVSRSGFLAQEDDQFSFICDFGFRDPMAVAKAPQSQIDMPVGELRVFLSPYPAWEYLCVRKKC